MRSSDSIPLQEEIGVGVDVVSEFDYDVMSEPDDDITPDTTTADDKVTTTATKRKLSGAWSFMSPPTKKDVTGGRRSSKGFDAPKKVFDQLIVLDFEWTCDDRKFGPPEIIEFPSVLLSGKFNMLSGNHM